MRRQIRVRSLAAGVGILAGLSAGLVPSRTAFAGLLEPEPVAVAAPQPVKLNNATLETVPLADIPLYLSFRGPRTVDRLVIETRRGQQVFLQSCAAALCAEPAGQAATHDPQPGQVPGTLTAVPEGQAKGGLTQAWLAEPVGRLGENAYGLRDAARLMVQDQLGDTHQLDLPLDQAFIDVQPRLVDLDGDKLPEILVVKAEVGRGATLAIIKFGSTGLRIIAESPSDGVPGSWLKPAGVADFDGDGERDIAVVRDPGPAGRLELWSMAGGQLTRRLSLRGFCNHVPGVAVDAMTVTGDFDGDGVPDLIVPSADRLSLRVISFRGGQVAEPSRVALSAPVATGIAVAEGEGGRPILAFGQEDGAVAVLGRDLIHSPGSVGAETAP
jgi:FG-GAP-like repeat